MDKETCRIYYKNCEITCEKGQNLRSALVAAGVSPHNGKSKIANCHGLGTCGTCAVAVEGEITDKTTTEKIRLSMYPHQAESGLRLSCQCKVMGDLTIKKGAGFWGQLPAEEDSDEQGIAPYPKHGFKIP